jgi:mRNA interferase YafQ
MNKYTLDYTTVFKKDYKRAKKRGYDMKLMDEVVTTLQKGKPLPEKNRDHSLTGNWKGYRECHIAPDWLLIYCIVEDKLILSLTRTGSHSDLDLY